MVSNLRVVYLTARPLKHLAESKRFIASVMENEQLLPSGPLLCNKVCVYVRRLCLPNFYRLSANMF